LKGNSGKGNNPLRDEWVTPDWIFKPLDKQYHFGFDCCATEKNRKTSFYSCNFESNLKLPFGNKMFKEPICWMNPPFSKAWSMFEHFFKVVKKGVAIYRCDNFETALWQKVIFPNATWVFIPNRRVSFEGLDGDGARFPSALIGFNVPKPKQLKGIVLEVG